LAGYSNRLVSYRFYFSFTLFKDIFRKYTGPNYFHQILSTLSFWSGLFISTFFLDKTSIGILTIFLSVSINIKQFLTPFAFHLPPLFSHLSKKMQYIKAKMTIKSLVVVYLLGIFLIMIALLTFGQPLYLLYFGDVMIGTYFAFLLFISGQLFRFLHMITGSYFFVTKIRMLIKIHFILLMALILLIIPLTRVYGFIGAVISYFIVSLIQALIHFSFFIRICKDVIDIIDLQIISLAFIPLIYLMISKNRFGLEPIFGIMLFMTLFLAVILIYRKKITELFHYIISEI